MLQLHFHMHRFFTARFGQPQYVAGSLLLMLLIECVWLIRADLHSGQITGAERFVLQRGLEAWHGRLDQVPQAHAAPGANQFTPVPGSASRAEDFHYSGRVVDPNRSALYYLVASAPLLLWHGQLDERSIAIWGWLARAPGLFFGLCLGASLWYVARRLYGNEGGYVALIIFCFSPGVIRTTAGWLAPSETGAAWGAFGAIFTGIAVAHTLYAPREVVLWNWRRIMLLAVALALAVGSQYSLVIVLVLVLGFLLYLAPERKGAALAIWSASLVLAILFLLASYFFYVSAFWRALRGADFFAFTPGAYGMAGTYTQLLRQLMDACPILVIALPTALVVNVLWRRARYFGNTAPLLVSVVFLALGLGMPHLPGLGFRFVALPFLMLFVAGIVADVLETRYRALLLPIIAGVLASYALWGVLELGRLRLT